MIRFRRLIYTTILISIWFISGFCQEGSISLESKVDKAKITIGDRVTLSIIVTRDENIEVEMPEFGANLGAFELLDFNDPELQKQDGKIIQIRDYIISTFDIGEYEIPPIGIRFTTKGDTVWQELTTEKIKIEVESVKPSEEGDIRDIKLPLELERKWTNIIRLSAMGLIIILIGILVYYFIKRRREGKALIPKREKPPRAPHVIALEELENLLNLELLEQGEIKLFYIQISDLIRKYIEGRYYIIAVEMTTYQLIQNMKLEQIEEEIIALTQNFLESCDLVKFAKFIPTSDSNEKIIEQAYELINSTKIEPIETNGEESKEEENTEQENEKEAVVDEQEEISASDEQVKDMPVTEKEVDK